MMKIFKDVNQVTGYCQFMREKSRFRKSHATVLLSQPKLFLKFFFRPGALLAVLYVEGVGGADGGHLHELPRGLLVGEHRGHLQGGLQPLQLRHFGQMLCQIHKFHN